MTQAVDPGKQGVAELKKRTFLIVESPINHLAWKDSLVAYKKALHKARMDYYSSLIEENKNNPGCLFSPLAKIVVRKNKKSHCFGST